MQNYICVPVVSLLRFCLSLAFFERHSFWSPVTRQGDNGHKYMQTTCVQHGCRTCGFAWPVPFACCPAGLVLLSAKGFVVVFCFFALCSLDSPAAAAAAVLPVVTLTTFRGCTKSLVLFVLSFLGIGTKVFGFSAAGTGFGFGATVTGTGEFFFFFCSAPATPIGSVLVLSVWKVPPASSQFNRHKSKGS